MKEYYIVDGMEGEMVRCETPEGGQQILPRSQLPPKVKEGDCLVFQGGCYLLDEQETRKRRKEAQEKINSLWE